MRRNIQVESLLLETFKKTFCMSHIMQAETTEMITISHCKQVGLVQIDVSHISVGIRVSYCQWVIFLINYDY